MTVLLVTSHAHDDLFLAGEPGHEELDAELARRGIEFRWVCWDDVTVDFASAELIAVRATWDYQERWEEFLAWAGALPPERLLNSAATFAWNVDKSYLARLPERMAVPTVVADDLTGVRAAVTRFGPSVVKPRIGAGGFGLVVAQSAHDPSLEEVDGVPCVVQPLVESVRTTGEVSVYVIDGQVTLQVQKWPAGAEVRVHEHFGGRTEQVAVDPDCVAVAQQALAASADFGGGPVEYARIDLLHHDGAWRVSEIEVTEPGLYLDVTDANAAPFADLLERRLRSHG